MALAQEQFDEKPIEDGSSELMDAEEPAEVVERPVVRGKQSDQPESRLALSVDVLNQVEDSMRVTLADVQRILHRVEVRRVHEDAGYSTCSEFESRMLAHAPLVRAMRQLSVEVRSIRPPIGDDRRDPREDRSRSVKALTSIAHALTRIRSLEGELSSLASRARDTLSHVESESLFEECGYASYEEFLERALGPSPLLACAVATLAEAPVAEPEVIDVDSAAVLDDDGSEDLPAALYPIDSESANADDPLTTAVAASATDSAASAQPSGTGSSSRLVVLAALGVVVCCAAGISGAYVGSSAMGEPTVIPSEGGAFSAGTVEGQGGSGEAPVPARKQLADHRDEKARDGTGGKVD